MSAEPVFLSISSRGTISLPAAMRRKLRLDVPGVQLAATLDETDKVITLRPHVAIPADQAWFWTPEWQAGERQADADIAAGRTTYFDSDEEFLASFGDDWPVVDAEVEAGR